MKKQIVLLLVCVGCCFGAMAQTKDVKADQKTLKSSVKDRKEDRHETGKDLTHFRVKAAARNHKETRRHSKSIHRQGQHLERHGVKDPVEKARHQVKHDKDVKKGKD